MKSLYLGLAASAVLFVAGAPGVPTAQAEGGNRTGKPRRPPAAVVLRQVRPAIVTVRVTATELQAKQPRVRVGLGVIIDPKGTVVMPRRLLAAGGTVEVELSDGRKFTPKAVHSDPKAGLAVLELRAGKPLPHAELGAALGPDGWFAG